MSTSMHASGRRGQALIWPGLRQAGWVARVLAMAVCLVALPADLRLDGDFRALGIGAAPAMAQDRGKGADGGGNERSARPDRDIDRGIGRDGARSNNDERHVRAPSSRGRVEVETDSTVATPGSRAAVAIGGALSERNDGPGIAPTQAGTARVRAMVEIARELGASFPSRSDQLPISGPVTQEMLDFAEGTYVAAVQEAWEAHGFPWNDPDVSRTLRELEALVSTLEGIMQAAAAEPGSLAETTIAADINNDGFVDINDLWDAHRR